MSTVTFAVAMTVRDPDKMRQFGPKLYPDIRRHGFHGLEGRPRVAQEEVLDRLARSGHAGGEICRRPAAAQRANSRRRFLVVQAIHADAAPQGHKICAMFARDIPGNKLAGNT